MQENYGTDLQTSHIGDGIPGSYSGDAKLKKHPLEFEPVINCPWGESNWEFGPYSPQTLKATSWVGAVVGGAPSSLYFEWNGPTPNDLPDEQLTAAAALVGLEMGTLTASLAAPVDGSVPQPTVSVRSTSTTPDVAPPATPAGYARSSSALIHAPPNLPLKPPICIRHMSRCAAPNARLPRLTARKW